MCFCKSHVLSIDFSPNISQKQKNKWQNIFFNMFFLNILSSKPQLFFFAQTKTQEHITHIRDALEAPVA